jgi:hypothetical protein
MEEPGIGRHKLTVCRDYFQLSKGSLSGSRIAGTLGLTRDHLLLVYRTNCLIIDYIRERWVSTQKGEQSAIVSYRVVGQG